MSLIVQSMTAIWREGRQPNFDPFGSRAVTPPNTPPSVSRSISNAPPPQSFVWIWIPLLPPLGRSTEAAVCTYLALILFIHRYHITHLTDVNYCDHRDYERGSCKRKEAIHRNTSACFPCPIRNLQGRIIYSREFRNSRFLSFLPCKKGESLISVFIAPRGGEE